MVSTNKSELILKGLLSIYPIGHDFERKELYTLSNEFTFQKLNADSNFGRKALTRTIYIS